MTIAAVILAGGASKRLGRPKQLIPIGGEPLLARTTRIASASRASSVAVVLGAHAREVEAAIPASVERILNPEWEEGLGTSVHAASRFAAGLPGCDGLLLLVCDQPRLDSEHLDRLIASFEETHRSIGSAYGGAIGVPAIFERARFPELLALRGDRGARALLRDAVAIEWPDGAFDVDVEADVKALL